jgi:hypothetical protein
MFPAAIREIERRGRFKPNRFLPLVEGTPKEEEKKKTVGGDELGNLGIQRN